MKRFFRKRRDGGGTDTWSIETMGRTSVVTENGKTASRVHDGAMQAEEEAERDVAERLSGGWFEIAEYAPDEEELDRRDYLRARWAPLTGDPPDLVRFRDWFSFLVETEECREVLARVSDRVRAVRVREHGVLAVTFAKQAGPLLCRAPARVEGRFTSGPMRRVVERHRSLSYQGPADAQPMVVLQVDHDTLLDKPEVPSETPLLCGTRDAWYTQQPSGQIWWNARDPTDDAAETGGELKGSPYGLPGIFLRAVLEEITRDLER